MLEKQAKKEVINQAHDKIFKKVLSDKTQVVGLLNHFFNLTNPLVEEDIERYSCKFVNSQFQNRETDILYKLKKTNVFFLIEHQSYVDYRMLQRIAEYQIEVIKVENSSKKNNKDFVIPLIIPLVLYSGTTSSWNVHTNFTDVQPVLAGYQNTGLGNYDVLDINNFKTEELLNSNLFLYRVLCIEKATSIEELTNILSYLLEHEKELNYRIILKDIITYIFKDTLKNDTIYEYFNKVEEGDDMSVVDMVLKEKNDLLTQGRLEGKIEGKIEGKREGIEKITIEMIKQNLDDNFIMKITKIDSKNLVKLKKKLNIL